MPRAPIVSPTAAIGNHPVPIPEGHDRAAKRLLGDVRMMADALRAFVHGGWTADLDLDTLRPLPAEHVSAELRRRRGDLLWTVELRGGGTVVIALEAQSTPDARMPARMMTLTGLICEGLAAGAWGADGGMPAVLPIVLHTGLRRWTPALDLAERAGPPKELAPYVAGHRLLRLCWCMKPRRRRRPWWTPCAARWPGLARMTSLGWCSWSGWAKY